MGLFKMVLSILLLFVVSKNFAQQKAVADTTDANSVIFSRVEVEAGFPGGQPAWQIFLEKNLKGDVPVNNGAPVGIYRVLVQFVVSKEGFVSDVKSITNLGYGMEQEVVRTIKKSGVWIPAQQDKRFVKAYRTQPVVFMVSADEFDINSAQKYMLFAGADNELFVEAGKVKSGDMRLTISKGTITAAGDGKFIARVNGTGRVIINVYKKNKNLGAVSFEIK